MVNKKHNQQTRSVSSLTPEEKDKLRRLISELNDSMTRIASERQLIKDAIDGFHDQVAVDKKLVRKLAKVYYNANFDDEIDENQTFESLYTTLFPSSKGTP